jgi:hypothetical protein
MKTQHKWNESPNEKLFFMNPGQHPSDTVDFSAKNSDKQSTFIAPHPMPSPLPSWVTSIFGIRSPWKSRWTGGGWFKSA